MSKRLGTSSSLSGLKKCKLINSGHKRISGLVPEELENADVEQIIAHLTGMYQLYGKAKNLPKVAMKNQLYAVMQSRSEVDRQVQSALDDGKIKLFTSGLGDEQYCMMLTEDYLVYLKHFHRLQFGDNEMSNALKKFVNDIVPACCDISVDKDLLMKKYHIKDEEITQLIKFGVLTVRGYGQWWLSIPCAGNFLKDLRAGRQGILQLIKRSSHKEISCDELLKRKVPNSVKFGFHYQLLDLIGSNDLRVVHMVTGAFLRVRNK